MKDNDICLKFQNADLRPKTFESLAQCFMLLQFGLQDNFTQLDINQKLKQSFIFIVIIIHGNSYPHTDQKFQLHLSPNKSCIFHKQTVSPFVLHIMNKSFQQILTTPQIFFTNNHASSTWSFLDKHALKMHQTLTHGLEKDIILLSSDGTK